MCGGDAIESSVTVIESCPALVIMMIQFKLQVEGVWLNVHEAMMVQETNEAVKTPQPNWEINKKLLRR